MSKHSIKSISSEDYEKTNVLDCGHEAKVCAYDSENKTSCQDCAEKNELSAFKKASQDRVPFTAYMNCAGDGIETWTGFKLADIISSKRIKMALFSTYMGQTIRTYTARDSEGKLWYGRGNAGMVTNLRRKGK